MDLLKKQHTKKIYDISNLKDFFEKSLLIVFSKFSNKEKKAEVLEKNGRLVMSCPYCGDSDSVDKKRGNFYINNQRYICYNGGCDASHSAESFVEYLKRFNTKDEPSFILGNTDNGKRLSSTHKIAFKKNTFYDRFPTFDEWIKQEYVKPLNKIDTEFLQNRLLSTNNLYSVKSGIIIGNFLPIQNEIFVLSHQIRKRDTNTDYRYLTKNLLQKQDIPELNVLSKIYNIGTVDMNNPLKVTEGYFDSTLIENAISCSGIKNVKKSIDFLDMFFDVNFSLYLDNDRDGMEYTKRLINKYPDINFFKWKSFLRDNGLKKIKDLNEAIIKKNDSSILSSLERYETKNKMNLFYGFDI